MGGERGVSQDFPDEHYWRLIDWIIIGFEPIPVLKYPLAYDSGFVPSQMVAIPGNMTLAAIFSNPTSSIIRT